MNFNIKKISGDASFREFYRLKKGKKTSIIVYAEKEKFKNLITYAVVNKILNENNIHAPKLINNYYKKNMIEISDFGNKQFYKQIIKKKDKFKDYKNLIKLILQIQKIKIRQKYKFGKFQINLKKYTISNLHKESDLFFDWYVKYSLRNKNYKKIKKIFKKELNRIYKKLNFNNNTFVHRDFHISNIMIDKKKLGLLDSQDAIIGNPLYDVASLIDDVRINLKENLQDKLFKYYCLNSKLKKESNQKLKNDFDILSLQRNLKILGIFVRLYKRDGKKQYLKYIPYTWQLIERRLNNPSFQNLNLLFKKFFKIKRLKKMRNL